MTNMQDVNVGEDGYDDARENRLRRLANEMGFTLDTTGRYWLLWDRACDGLAITEANLDEIEEFLIEQDTCDDEAPS